MSIKKTAKKYLPRSYVYNREYRLLMRNARKTYKDAEHEIDEKFKKVFGRKINWENPETYNEKLNVVKLYGATPQKTSLTDKILAAKWINEHSSGECKTIPLIATYDSIDEIDFAKLPEQYVMKMNNDSGSVFIHDKKHPVTRDLIAQYKYFFQKRNYAYSSYEMHYKDIKPKIMIEKYMGGSIRDYKFQCFGGKCYSCRVDFDRFGNHTRNFYDRNWTLLPFNKGSYNNNPKLIEKPRNYEKMWKLAETLSRDFDQVRVDFYDIDNEVFFGEMTFTNGAGLEWFHPDEVDIEIGKLWKLDMVSIRKRRNKTLESGARIKD